MRLTASRSRWAVPAVAFHYAWGAVVLWQTYGLYRPIYLASLFVTWLIAMTCALDRQGATSVALPRRALEAWCALMPLVWSADVVLLHAHSGPALSAFRASGAIVGALALAAALSRARPRLADGLLATAIAGCFCAQALVLMASPAPFIDVFHGLTAAADHLAAGRNPYAQSYEDIYRGAYPYPAGMQYWPATLAVVTLSRALTGDVRTGFVVAQALTCVALHRAARRLGADRGLARWLVLAWLVHPVGPLVLEQAWVDPLHVASFAWLALALLERGVVTAGVALGLAASFKQYGLLGALAAVVYVARTLGARSAVRAASVGALVFAAFMAPFLVWDAPRFVAMTVTIPATQPMRLDASSLLVPLARSLPEPWPSRVTGAVALLSLLLTCGFLARRAVPTLADFAIAMSLLYGVLFFFAKQAFCNYHYFAAFFALLYVGVGLSAARRLV